MLGHAHAHPELTGNKGNIALLKMAAAAGLIPDALAESVRNAYRARSEADEEMGEPAPTSRAGREQFQDDEAATFFQRLSSHWKKQYPGWTAWIPSPDMKLPSAMRLKESRRVVMFNGPIECRLFRFDLVAASNKPRAAAPTDTELPPSPSQGD